MGWSEIPGNCYAGRGRRKDAFDLMPSAAADESESQQ